MRILNIMLSNGRGGIESAFAHYSAALEMAGAEVIACISANRDRTIALPAGRIATICHRSQLDPRAIWQAMRLIAREKPDAILVHGRRALMITALATKLMRCRAPLVQVLHRPRFKNMAWCHHTITVSEALRAGAIAAGAPAHTVTAIPNFLLTLPMPAPARPWHKPVQVGLLARLVPEKGIDLAIEALALLNARGIRLTLQLGGTGREEANLRALAAMQGVADQIHWLGWVEDSRAFWQGIDLFLLPSRAESFGLVVLEAFAHAVPVIATRTSGPSEIITHNKNGLLCAISAESIADNIALAVANEQQARAYAATALSEIPRYSAAQIAPRILACLTAAAPRR